MRILLANTTAYPVIGGVENSLRFIGRELLRLGHEVQIFCLQTSSSQALQTELDGIKIIRYPCRTERWPRARQLAVLEAAREGSPAVIQDFRPDSIWSRSAPIGMGIRCGGYTGSMLQVFPTNARMNCRGLYLQTRGLPWKRRLMLLGLWPSAYISSVRLERALSRQCTSVAFSDNMRRQLLAGFGTDVRACHVIPPGVDPKHFSPETGSQYFDEIHRKFGLCPNEPNILYVGRISVAKNIPMLLDAMLHLDPRTKLTLVGEGHDESQIRTYAARVGISDRVILAGSHSEMLPGFYAICRVSVLPTTTESFGQVYLESLACGTPAVGFAGDGNRVLTASSEILRDGDTGSIVTSVNAKALAEGIDAILSRDNTDYAAMSARARESVLARFTWKNFVETAISLVEPGASTVE